MSKPLVIGPDLPQLVARLRDTSRVWAAGRHWPARLALLAYVIYAIWQQWHDPETSSWFGGLTFLVHELGHVLFRPFGEWFMFAGGTITQLAVPVVTGVMFWRQGDRFGPAISGGWLALSLFNVARYVGDAEDMALPLLGLGPDPEHDWHYLLDEAGRLAQAHVYEGRLNSWAVIIGAVSCLYGAWLISLMIRHRRPIPAESVADV